MTNREKHNYKNIPLCDTHIHPVDMRRLQDSFDTLRDIVDYFAYKRATFCCLTNLHDTPDPLNNLKGLYLKDMLNAHYGEDRIFVYGDPLHHYDERDTAAHYLRQVQDMYAWGVDGYKILDGKPSHRLKLDRPLCDPIFDPMYAFIEEKGMPVKLHLGDPAYFWGDRSEMSAYAIRRGWWYGGGGYPSLESLRGEVEEILTKFPKLKLCLAHFYFMSEEPDQLSAFFERWENVSVDLTPGGEMFRGMTNHYAQYQQFYRAYSHRIFFGTDTYNTEISGESMERYEGAGGGRCNLVRRMMEGDPAEEFPISIIGAEPIVKPLGLDDALLRNIYFDNHCRLHPVCRPLNKPALADALRAFDLALIPAEFRALEEENLTVLRAWAV